LIVGEATGKDIIIRLQALAETHNQALRACLKNDFSHLKPGAAHRTGPPQSQAEIVIYCICPGGPVRNTTNTTVTVLSL
jgi:hypothetical protein